MNNKEEITKIMQAILLALPVDVDIANIIIALAQVQQTMAELIIDNDPFGAMSPQLKKRENE